VIIQENKTMAFETKEELLERYLKMEKPHCPHCNQEMSLWEVPPINFSDGLGWGTPYLFVCFNDDCPSYQHGWKHLYETMEAPASYRCINEPGQTNFEYMPVFSPIGGTGSKLDEEAVVRQQAQRELAKKTFSILTDYYMAKDWDEILKIALDPSIPARARLKAIEMVGDIGDVQAVEHLNNHKFPSPKLQEEADNAVAKLHERHFTRECPFCAEIIKKRAKICKYCNREVPQAV
jgi:hypothetical protein